jgi:hypothetical protein
MRSKGNNTASGKEEPHARDVGRGESRSGAADRVEVEDTTAAPTSRGAAGIRPGWVARNECPVPSSRISLREVCPPFFSKHHPLNTGLTSVFLRFMLARMH